MNNGLIKAVLVDKAKNINNELLKKANHYKEE
jgi:hypothetical protein